MRNVLTIARYEFKMQITNKVFWTILLITSVLSIWEQFPSTENLNRLEHLTNHGYIASRSLTLTGIFLMFASVFIIANRIRIDMEQKTTDILFSTPITKGSYIWGKFLGNYFTSITMCTFFIGSNAAIQAMFNPSPFEILPYIKSLIFITMPTMIFVVGLSTAIPVLIDIRIFYASMSAYFMYCILVIPNTYEIPFYWIIGDTRKLIYRSFEVPYRSIILNNVFLIGIGLCSIGLLSLSSKCLWREQ